MAPHREPDGPPLSNADRKRFTDQLADGITQAYAAIYRDRRRDAAPLTVVHALLFASPEGAAGFVKELRMAASDVVRIGDRTVVQVAGPADSCAYAVRAHINSLIR